MDKSPIPPPPPPPPQQIHIFFSIFGPERGVTGCDEGG